MFRGYTIKKAHGEERLYLYLDMTYEIAKFNKNNNNKASLIDQIIDYVKVNNIKFSGTKIVLIVGGLVLGTVFLNTNLSSLNVKETKEINYVDKVFLNSYTKDNELDKINTIKIVQTKEVEEIQIKQEKPIEEKKKETKGKVNTNNNTSANNNTTQNNSTANNTVPKKTTPPSTTTTPSKQTNNTMVTVYRSNGTIQQIELEEYLIGVVAAEMPASFSEEALKVQAIIARTYTLRLIAANKVLTDTTSTQVYKDNNQLKNLWGTSYNTYYNKIKKAVDSTKGMKITYNGNLIEALYFSCSNGQTEDSINVWGNSYSYLKSVDSKWDVGTTAYLKDTNYNYDNLSKILGTNIDSSTLISVNNKNTSNRVASITVNNKTYTGVEFRNLLGLRSADFDIEIISSGIKITTRGYGHGVGLSQYGANEMAKLGYTYLQIIKHYYSGVTITN